MAARESTITLLTDFGTKDPFVGVMKGVILGIAPGVSLVDLTHEVPPQDIESAAYHLSNAWRHFPRGTVHIVVVDPGVGSARRALAVGAGDHLFVAPDNGVLTPVFNELDWRACEITAAHYLRPQPSATFHGRDVFAPAAAHLARGASLDNFGDPVENPVRLDLLPPIVERGALRARVVHVDRFGNLVLNATRAHLARLGAESGAAAFSAEAGGRRIDHFVTHYAASGGKLCLLINSDGRLEIALPGGSASADLGLGRGGEVLVQRG